MPLEYNNTMCITVDEWQAAGLSYYEYENDKKRGYLNVERGGARNRPALINIDSIIKPERKAKIVEMFGDLKVAETKKKLADIITPDEKAIEFFSNFILANGRHLPDKKVDEYSANAMILNGLHVIYTRSLKARKKLGKGNNTKFWGKAAKAILSLKKETKHNLQKNEHSLKRAYKSYVDESYISIISKKYCNDNSRKVDDNFTQLFNNLFSTQAFKPTYADIQRQYDGFINGYVIVTNNITGEQYNPKEFTRLSPATISNYLVKWSSKIGNEAKRSGDRQVYMGKYNPYHSLERPTYAGSIISIDDRQPPFEYAENKRMWFYNGIDLASGAYTVSVVGKTKEGIIIDFYRQMVRNYHQWGFNLPAELEAETSLNIGFKETFLKEGCMFKHVRIEAHNARGKRIEQYFRQLRYAIEKKDENWIARPFAKAEANQTKPEKGGYTPHDDTVATNKPKKTYVPFEKNAGLRLGELEQWNNMAHDKNAGETKWEYFVENQNPDLPPTNYRGILPHLGYETKTSCRVGRVALNNGKFMLGMKGQISKGEELINIMQQIEGEKIKVYWLDANDGSMIKAYAYLGDRFVCELLPEVTYNRAKIEQTDEDRENRSIMSAYQLTITAFGKQQKNKIETVTVEDNTPITLNDKFVMPGFGRENKSTKYQGTSEEAEKLPDMPINENFDKGSTGLQSSFKDRF